MRDRSGHLLVASQAPAVQESVRGGDCLRRRRPRGQGRPAARRRGRAAPARPPRGATSEATTHLRGPDRAVAVPSVRMDRKADAGAGADLGRARRAPGCAAGGRVRKASLWYR